MDVDVLIVGGGAAGIEAALVLGRQRRTVLVVDSGEQRNLPAAGIHMLPGQEGTSPGDFYRAGRGEIAQLETVSYVSGRVVELGALTDSPRSAETAGSDDHGVRARLDNGRSITAKYCILATGQHDQLDSVPGLADLWGTAVLHCPYCHGWEARDMHIAAVQLPGTPAWMTWYRALSLAERLAGSVTLVTEEAPDEPLAAKLRQAGPEGNGVKIVLGRVLRLSGERGDVRIRVGAHETGVEGDVEVGADVVFAMPESTAGLRCIPEGIEMAGPHIVVDSHQRTSLPRFYAAGDASISRYLDVPHPPMFVGHAIGQGQAAGFWVDQRLFQESITLGG